MRKLVFFTLEKRKLWRDLIMAYQHLKIGRASCRERV